MEALNLSTNVLEWAARQAGESLESLASELSKRNSQQILTGRITIAQARKLADRAGVPFGYLFLAQPPASRELPLTDLRQTQDVEPLTSDFVEVLEDAEDKRDWFKEYLTDIGALPLPFVGQFSSKTPTAQIAESIRSTIGLTDADRAASINAAAYFSKIAELAEASGILVLKSGIVRANTHRPLSVKQFRGFALADSLAPLVFVNGRDAAVATVFTLAHELAHIWLGASAVSDVTASPSDPIEVACNAAAAQLLVPQDSFVAKWHGKDGIPQLAAFYRVSQLVIARRALDFGYIGQHSYDEISSRPVRIPTKKPSGGSAYVTLPVRNSKMLTNAVTARALSGQLLLRDAARLLNVRPSTVVSLGRHLARESRAK